MKKILILGLGAFGFAIAKHLGENNPEQIFYASEVNQEIFSCIEKSRTHPYFFEGVLLPENIELVGNAGLRSLLQDTDIIISVIPCQFVGGAFASMKPNLKEGVTILNLSKGINNDTLQTTSEKLAEVLCSPQPSPREDVATKILPSLGEGLGESFSYTYAYLAGGMIAAELVGDDCNRPLLGADIVCEDEDVGEDLRNLFQSENLDIHLIIGPVKNTELYAALKNIIALILGYYEGQGNGASTLGYYLTRLLKEIELLVSLLASSQSFSKNQNQLPSLGEGLGESLNFTDYALGGDIIATCFGASRNRMLGNMLGKGTSIENALAELAEQKKIAEGYETLKGVYKITKGKDEFELMNSFGEKYI